MAPVPTPQSEGPPPEIETGSTTFSDVLSRTATESTETGMEKEDPVNTDDEVTSHENDATIDAIAYDPGMDIAAQIPPVIRALEAAPENLPAVGSASDGSESEVSIVLTAKPTGLESATVPPEIAFDAGDASKSDANPGGASPALGDDASVQKNIASTLVPGDALVSTSDAEPIDLLAGLTEAQMLSKSEIPEDVGVAHRQPPAVAGEHNPSQRHSANISGGTTDPGITLEHSSGHGFDPSDANDSEHENDTAGHVSDAETVAEPAEKSSTQAVAETARVIGQEIKRAVTGTTGAPTPRPANEQSESDLREAVVGKVENLIREAVQRTAHAAQRVVPKSVVSAAWLQSLLDPTSGVHTGADGWKMLEMKLDDGDGTMTIRTRREAEHVVVSVGFSDPRVRDLAQQNMDRLHEALNQQYETAVDFSLDHDQSGSNENDRHPSRRITKDARIAREASKATETASSPELVRAGARHVWVG